MGVFNTWDDATCNMDETNQDSALMKQCTMFNVVSDAMGQHAEPVCLALLRTSG